jgi:hypothetical protein
MNSLLSFDSRTFPSRIADLGFTVKTPKDWIAHELPKEEADFSNPTKFVPLAVVTAPHSAIVIAFAARPAYDDGTLHDWAWYLLQHNQLKPRAVGAGRFGQLAAVLGEAIQDSDVGPLVVRFAFVEDGKRLINITLTAPELLADAVKDAWFAAVESFALTSPRGATVAVQQHASPACTPAL